MILLYIKKGILLMPKLNLLLFILALCVTCLTKNHTHAQEFPPSKRLINNEVIQSIKEFVDTDIVRLSIEKN